MQQLDLCKQCVNRTVSRSEGILCGLTDAKPDFEDHCPDYLVDEAQLKRQKRYDKSFNSKSIHLETAKRSLMLGGPLLMIGGMIYLMPVLNANWPVLILIGAITALVGLVFVILGIVQFFLINQSEKESSTSSGDEIDEIF